MFFKSDFGLLLRNLVKQLKWYRAINDNITCGIACGVIKKGAEIKSTDNYISRPRARTQTFSDHNFQYQHSTTTGRFAQIIA